MFGVAILLLGCCALFFLQEQQRTASLEDEIKTLQTGQRAQLKLVPGLGEIKDGADLPAFSSIELVQSLNDVSSELQVALDEVAYTLSDSPSEPYLRYRITLRLTAPYPVMRKFSDSLAGSLTHIALDSIACARQDALTVPLTCDLAFSAFYRRAAHA